MRVIHTTPRKINIVGIDDHELTGLNLFTAAALLDTQKGPIIGVSMNMLTLERAGLFMLLVKWNGSTAKLMTDPKLLVVQKRIETPEGYVIPLSIESGLVYMHSIRIPTDQDLQNYPHVFFVKN